MSGFPAPGEKALRSQKVFEDLAAGDYAGTILEKRGENGFP